MNLLDVPMLEDFTIVDRRVFRLDEDDTDAMSVIARISAEPPLPAPPPEPEILPYITVGAKGEILCARNFVREQNGRAAALSKAKSKRGSA